MTARDRKCRNQGYLNGESISVIKYIEVLVENIKSEIAEARRVMEDRMAGFPAEFAKKSEMTITASVLKDLKDKDLREIKDLCEDRLTKEEYNQRHEVILDKVRKVENDVANIQGRIAATGVVGVVVVVAVQILIHIFWGK